MPEVHAVGRTGRPHCLAAIACLGGALSSAALAAAPAPATTPGPTAPKIVEVGSARGIAGQRVRGSLNVAERADGSSIALPIVIVTGRETGPAVWIDALNHGDEYGGSRALQELVRGLDPERVSGSLIAVMAANPPAFEALQRVNPSLDDLTDLGGAFPGRPERFATERIAAALTEQVKKHADYFVDLHTGGDRFKQHPFVLYTLTGGVPAERYDGLARSFGVKTLWRDAEIAFKDDAVTTFSAAGIPSFLLEVGGGQPLDPADLRLQADALRSFLKKTGFLPGAPHSLESYQIVSGYRIVTNDRGGFFDAVARPGDPIREGTVLGTITDVQGDLVETIRAPAGAAIVLGVSTYPASPTGGWLFEVGTGLSEMKGESKER